MGRTSRENRPFVRKRSSIRGSAAGSSPMVHSAGRSPAKGLTTLAGLTDRPNVEQLERRQMLFSLTVTADDVDPNTGLGTVTQYFGYYIPYLISVQDIPDAQEPTAITEPFDDENQGAVGSGNPFLESGIIPRTNINVGDDFSIQPPGQAQDRHLRVNLNDVGEFFSFRVPGNTMTTFTMNVSPNTTRNPADNTGILVANTRVTLLQGNVVVQTIQGAQQVAALFGGNALGVGTFTVNLATGFDEVRFELISAPPNTTITAFEVDDLTAVIPDNRFVGLLDARGFGAVATLTGPVGASANFRDLYGRDMSPTLAVKSSNGGVNPGSPNQSGRPNYNDGIGSITLSGTDSRTALTLIGGTIEFFEGTPPTGVDFIQGNYAFTIVDNLEGFFSDFEAVGFGYAYDQDDDTITATGLPPGPGSVIVGSPYLRALNNYNPAGPAGGLTITTGFTRADQGVFVNNGSIGSVYINGVLHGSSQFAGAVDRLYVSYLVGSITVQGDLGSFVGGTDAGQWLVDADFVTSDPNRQIDDVNKTGSQIVVGRTLGEIAIAGRSLVDIVVVGDVNSPTTRPPRDTLVYYEKEYVLGLPTDTPLINVVRRIRDLNAATVNRQPSDLLRTADQPYIFGFSMYRNDSILSAEWVGSISSGVRIKGDLSGRDPVNGADDDSDVYAFAVDGTQDVVVEGLNAAGALYFRIVDQDGRTVAAPAGDVNSESRRFGSTRLRFTPERGPGVYYLVVSDPNGGTETGVGSTAYSVLITGMATAALGALRTGGGSGYTDLNTGEGNTLAVLSGGVGSLRIGTSYLTGGLATADIGEIVNTTLDDEDDITSFFGGTFTISGNLYNITTGSDIGDPEARGGGSQINITVTGDFGSLVTGLSPTVGQSVNEGDVGFLRLSVGGRISTIDVRGGIGMDQDDEDGDPLGFTGGRFVIITGTNGGSGDIGMIRVGFHVVGSALDIRTSPGSTVGALLISQDAYGVLGETPDPRSGIYESTSLQGISVNVGAGSDVRFFDVPLIDTLASRNFIFPLIGGQTLTLIDDAGSAVDFVVDGLEGVQVGQIRALRIDGSQGVAIGSVTVDLSGGVELRVAGRGSNAGVISIGRVIVTGGDVNSALVFSGSVEIDVYRIESAVVLDRIENQTPGGDFVAVDVLGVNTISVKGDIGRTQIPAWGPTRIGPLLGLSVGAVGDVRGALGVPAEADDDVLFFYDDDFNGEIYRPITGGESANFTGGNAYLDDIGSILNDYLNGIVVRSGFVEEVRADGAIGDVILQGTGAGDGIDLDGTLGSVVANADRVTPLGRFDGLIGSILAVDIESINFGDGIRGNTEFSPIARAGILAIDDINQIFTSINSGSVVVSGSIGAGNLNPDDEFVDNRDGIGEFVLNAGSVINARIASENVDGFWTSFQYGEDNVSRGDINSIRISNANFFKSGVAGRNLSDFRITNGFFDASTIFMTGNVDRVAATGFRNSTLTGESTELRLNDITVAGNLNRLSAVEDINDLTVDVSGTLDQSIAAVNISRSSINVANIIRNINLTQDFRGSVIVAGALQNMTVARNIVSSSITISGVISNITVADSIRNTRIEVSGPDGRIERVTAVNLFSGSLIATGPINNVTVSNGDLRADVRTTTSRGNVGVLSAARDLVITADVSGNITSLVAGRHLGDRANPSVILARGTVNNISLPNGQLYSSVYARGAITGQITIGSAVSRQGNDLSSRGAIVSSGRINAVVSNGDFGGDIISYSGGIGSVTINNGSFLSGARISASDGSINSITINNGHLLGSVNADLDIVSLRVIGGVDGVFGDIGVNPDLSAATSYDGLRNQLPAGVTTTTALNGPTISAGRNIVLVDVTNGSVFEAVFSAGRAIQRINVVGSVRNDNVTGGFGTAFVAGDSIDLITVTGGASNAQFIAGVENMGGDGRPGGVLANTDRYKPGIIRTVTIGGGVSNTQFIAGIDPVDGIWDNGNDRSVFGLSSINTLNLSGAITNVLALSDSLSASVANDNRLIRGGTNLPSTNSELDNGSGTPGVSFTGSRTFTLSDANVTINFTGAGQAFFDTGTRRLTLRNTTAASAVTITSSTGALNNVDIISNNNASLGSLRIQANLTGDSDIIIDGSVTTFEVGNVSGTGTLAFGGDVNSATFASLTGGFFSAQAVPTLRINGDFGAASSAIIGEAAIQVLSSNAINITGAVRASLSVDRDAGAINIGGALDRAQIRAGVSIQSFTAPSLRQSFLTAGDSLGAVTIGGDVFDSVIAAGLDLGRDGNFGGTGVNADVLGTGTIGAVQIAGNFRESDLLAGYLRGPDGFFGTADDTIAPGISTMQSVTIGGTQVGSSRNSESYRIASSGTLGQIRIGGQIFSGTLGNFATEAPNLPPLAIQILETRVQVDSQVTTANIVFNQPMNSASLAAAILVSELRGEGDVQVSLIQGVDYTLRYVTATNTLQVIFSRAVTERNLPQLPGQPGPGVYRFSFDSSILQAKLSEVRADGNNDGLSRPGEIVSDDAIIGDAGDKFFNDSVVRNGNTFDFYAATNLNIVFDSNSNPDGLPEPNVTRTIRGFIGDHPDQNTNLFRFAGDVDVFRITLQAGQIVRLGALQGSASLAGVTFFTAAGVPLGQFANDFAIALPAPAGGENDLTFANDFLIKQTGTYFIAVGNTANVNVVGGITNPESIPPNSIGDYSFTLQIFDDGDSGFTSGTDSGDGAVVVNAPAPSVFAGGDGIFGTADDQAQIVIGSFRFTHSYGPDGLPNTADDLVTGDNGAGIVSTRTGSGRLTSTVSAAIGPAGFAGVPGNVTADVDVFHLNNRSPIAPGTKMRATVKLTGLGADLGSASPLSFVDLRGSVQFGLFETTNSVGADDAILVFSPTDFSPNGGRPNTVIADNGSTRYGFDANGDFYIEFITPDSQFAAGSSGAFAFYVQGAFNTDYQLEVVTEGTGTTTRVVQNVLIETSGGVINWLEAGGINTNIGAFSARVLGFTGTVSNGQTAEDYILTQLIAQLNTLFQSTGAGYDVRFSLNPSDFEFQPFSTVFLSSSVDPVLPVVNPFAGFNFDFLSNNLFNTQPFGFAQHVDPFNADLEDEAVVFLPSFATQGFTPSQTDIDAFVDASTAAVARRVGNLMGLRVTDFNNPGTTTTFDPFAANSVDNRPPAGQNYLIPGFARNLSSPFDSVDRTNFFLGRQNSASLLDKILARRG